MSFRDPVDTPGPRADLAPLVLPRLVIRRLLPTAALRPWVDHYWFVQGLRRTHRPVTSSIPMAAPP